MKKILHEFISSGGKVSSKRCIVLAIFLLVVIEVLVELFTPLAISQNTHDTLMYSFDVVVGSIVLEKFSPKDKTINPKETENLEG